MTHCVLVRRERSMCVTKRRDINGKRERDVKREFHVCERESERG